MTLRHGRLLVGDVEVQPDLRPARPDAVRDRQAALELLRRLRARERLEQRLRLAVGDRRRRDPRQVPGLLRAMPRRARHRRDARRQRIAGVVEDVLDRAALDPVGGAPRAVGVDRPAREAVVGGVGVDDHALRAAQLGLLGLDAAERAAVADEHDLALDARRRARRAPRSPWAGRSSRRRPRRTTSPGGRVGVVARDDVVEVLLPREAALLAWRASGGTAPSSSRGSAPAARVDAVAGRADVQPVGAQALSTEICCARRTPGVPISCGRSESRRLVRAMSSALTPRVNASS